MLWCHRESAGSLTFCALLVFTRQDGLLATMILWNFLLVKSNPLLIARRLVDVFGHSVFVTARRLGPLRESFPEPESPEVRVVVF
jgi:hypothetical protein